MNTTLSTTLKITSTLKYEPTYEEYSTAGSIERQIKNPCQNCPNSPNNGGSGICHCILGNQVIY